MNKEKQKPPPWLVRHEATNQAAQIIIDDETANRNAKTERLRTAREARDGELPILVAPERKSKPAKVGERELK